MQDVSGFLRTGEVVAPPGASFDPSVHLTVGDVSVDSWSAPSYVAVNIKASKTDPFRQGVTIYLGRTHNRIYPLAATLNYLVARGTSKGPCLYSKMGDIWRATVLSQRCAKHYRRQGWIHQSTRVTVFGLGQPLQQPNAAFRTHLLEQWADGRAPLICYISVLPERGSAPWRRRYSGICSLRTQNRLGS